MRWTTWTAWVICCLLTLSAQSVFDARQTVSPPAPSPMLDSVEPRGAAAMSAFERLPYLKPGTTVHQASSYDRTGLNDDGSRYYHYQNPRTGGFVVLEAHKPGTIYRLWATALEGGNLRIYFDGENSPRVDVPIGQFFSGTMAPFLAPFVGNDLVSSGGNYSYYPFAFRESVRVEFTNVPRFYNITYHLYNTPDGVATYTGNEDLTAARAAWMNPTVDPKAHRGSQTILSPFDLPPGQTATLLTLQGAGSINQFVLQFPQFFTTQYVGRGKAVQDNGRSHQGTSSFTVAIEPDNVGVMLERRSDYYVTNQAADVYVDGRLAGRWFDRGSDWLNRWRNLRFMIPEQFTRGKSSIRVELRFAGLSYDWREFYYWVRSVLADVPAPRLTDTLDIGNAASELKHNYVITEPRYNGTETYTYPPDFPTRYDPATLDVLGNARILVFWDEEEQPSVDVPLGFLFGVGAGGEGSLSGLLTGVMPETHTYYNYFPMPFRRSARVLLVNDSTTPIQGARGHFAYDLDSATVPIPGVNAGYFTAIYNREDPTVAGRDFLFGTLNSGAGHVVGLVQNIRSDSVWALEGDERIFIDDLEANPQVHGTGTEDLYNCGWYFANGILSLPVHGAPLIHWYTEPANHTLYRWSIADAFVFERSIKLKIEHGATNDYEAPYEGAVFAYLAKGLETLEQTDTLVVGDPDSEQIHNYVVFNPTWYGTGSYSYVGRDDDRSFTGSGRAHRGSSEFTVAIHPDNYGVRLARILDFSSANQQANVYVDGQPAGVWLTPGRNQTHRASLDFFEIAPALTANKQSIRVRIEFVSASGDWTEFRYTVYTHAPNNIPLATPTAQVSATAVVTGTPPTTITPPTTGTPATTITPWPSGTTLSTPSPVSTVTTPTAHPTVCTITFADIPVTNTFYPFVRCLACRGVISGYSDGTFRPDNAVTPGQIAKIVSLSAGFTEPVPTTQQSFEDVVYGSPFWEYIERLYTRNVIGGYQCGIYSTEPCVPPANRPYFRPNTGATRGQLVKIASQSAGFSDITPDTHYTFTDVEPGHTFWLYIERLLLNRPGAIQGYPCGGPFEPCDSENRPYFRPYNGVTRGQTSKIVANTFFPGCNPAAR